MDTSKPPLSLDEKFSTTRILTKEKPVIKNNPDDKSETVLFLPKVEGRKAEGGLRTRGYFKKSLPDKPLITVVTVVFNGEEHLDQAILSVLNQSYDNVEYIIIDGGSTDKTIETIKKYENAINYWVSEPDKGIYDAMNKGMRLSSGDYIYFLGSDDILLTLPYQAIKNGKSKNIGIVYGNVLFDSGKLFKCQYNLSITIRNTLSHQGLFMSRNLFENFSFNTNYKVYADFDLNQRMYKSKITYLKDKSVVAFFRLGGASSLNSTIKIEELKQEYSKVILNNFGYFFLLLSYLVGIFRKMIRPSDINAYPDFKTLKKILIKTISS